MKIIGIVGSPRKEGNSFYLIKEALKGAKENEPSIETEIIQLALVNIEPCRACERCANEPHECVNNNDDFKSVLEKMKNADKILLASPKYGPLGAMPSRMQALLERLMNVSYLPKHNNPYFVAPLSNKPCGLLAVSAEGRQNTLPVLHNLEQYALAFHMCVIHALEWPWVGVCGKGNEKGDVLKDSHAMKNAKKLGKLLAQELNGK
ncbi:MAG: flavodoxin family protein [Candidatus Bathyarchaeota archaeon]|nr:flavodoxin family protein [Candidatus Bathyarchaeota archaeon]